MTRESVYFPDCQPYPQEPALIAPGMQFSYTHLLGRARSITDRLCDIDCRPGALLGILVDPGPEYPILLLAAWMNGMITAPLNTRLPDKALARQLENLNCTELVTDRHPSGLPGVRVHAINDFTSGSGNDSTPFLLPLYRQLTLVHTSGSTGAPRAALHTAGNHVYNALGSNRNIPLGPGDRWLLSLPLYHVGGLAILFRCWLAGAAVAVPGPDQSLANAIRELRPTHLSLVATQLQRLLDDPNLLPDLQNTKAILLGGSAIPEALIRRAHEAGLPIHTSYGSTEMASQITTTAPGADIETLLTSGVPLPYREIMIADSGEIRVRGKTLFSGYVTGNHTELPVDKDGWLPTGDTGTIGTDGSLRVTGRLDDMFISGGENIQPAEIERALERIPGVERAIVVAVPHPEFGHRPVAFVNMTGNRAIPEQRLRNELAARLEKYKIPDRFLPWPANQDPEAMKIDRRGMAELAIKLIK